MATKASYLEYMRDQLSGLDVSFRAMMGEYVLYVRDRVAGGLYDDRLLVKDVPSARVLMPDAPLEEPYPSAKKLILVENTDDRAFLARLLQEIYPELPAPKKRVKK